jgi:hypothetical protein
VLSRRNFIITFPRHPSDANATTPPFSWDGIFVWEEYKDPNAYIWLPPPPSLLTISYPHTLPQSKEFSFTYPDGFPPCIARAMINWLEYNVCNPNPPTGNAEYFSDRCLSPQFLYNYCFVNSSDYEEFLLHFFLLFEYKIFCTRGSDWKRRITLSKNLKDILASSLPLPSPSEFFSKSLSPSPHSLPPTSESFTFPMHPPFSSPFYSS